MLAGFVLVASVAVGAPHGSIPSSQPLASVDENLLRSLINTERSAQGLGSLRMITKAVGVARKHSSSMAQAGSIFHNERLPKQLRRVRWDVLGENVGVGGDTIELHQAFMNSPPHRHNVLSNEYERIGVGTLVTGGRMWVTVVFVG
ncbi:MAG TPA: CAP domain-containing protein [Actinomycetota bacterium]|nr:CAP domain-containing protein [Actinomycetota bacterium]